MITTLQDGSTIWYERKGNGPLLFHIHGSGFGHRNFYLLSPEMVDDFEVVDFDLPGYGESVAAGPVGIYHWADQVAEFIRSQTSEPVYVHGTSMGGLVAFVLAARHPDVVKKLAVTVGMLKHDKAARFMRSTWKRGARAAGMAYASDLTAVAGFSRAFFDRDDAQEIIDGLVEGMSRNDPESFVAGTESVEALDLTDEVKDVAAPTILIAGDEDNMTPLHSAPSGMSFDRAVDIMPDARLEVVEGAGHYIVLEKPKEVAAIVRSFLLA